MKGSTTVMSEPLAGYDVCYSGTVRGTLKGQLITCFSFADFYTSDSLWGDTNFVYWIAKGTSFLKTSKGEIFFEERGVYDFATELAAGQGEVTGGTGSYQGATGVLQFRNKWPNRLDLFVYEGQICTP